MSERTPETTLTGSKGAALLKLDQKQYNLLFDAHPEWRGPEADYIEASDHIIGYWRLPRGSLIHENPLIEGGPYAGVWQTPTGARVYVIHTSEHGAVEWPAWLAMIRARWSGEGVRAVRAGFADVIGWLEGADVDWQSDHVGVAA